ncbi:hypothetical protein LTR78_000389 [Recurvomyces mirabilis]|uniref:Uncharacterized protein n=1 Tax=Recurvomyces mirabilis TaxID=574656 RepID=A0AAE1C6I8_9PEZI|nr:hypothetical protein LTR78_000389 [Recurvomyces mirabilis]KAK5162044.1 hypothetical protein LTS14_000390 [Recurvomyces mirabilis]
MGLASKLAAAQGGQAPVANYGSQQYPPQGQQQQGGVPPPGGAQGGAGYRT